MSPLKRLIFLFAVILKKNPITFIWAWNLLRKFAFYKPALLLPHDKSYLGIGLIPELEGGFYLDVGANNGLSALSILAIDPKANVLSIEANRYHQRSLNAIHQRYPRCDFKIVAAGTEPGTLTFTTPVFLGQPITLYTSLDKAYLQREMGRVFPPLFRRMMRYEQDTVEVIPLDQLELKPAFIKVDAEGVDHLVLQGLRQTIENAQAVVMFEYDPDNFEHIAQLFTQLNYHLIQFDAQQSCFTPFDISSTQQEYDQGELAVNPYAVPKAMKERLLNL
ncbi:FkbM family methyltransferase [Magnetococcus sp. PR-3]|uniref:FkbM family methyltransferase n=1 Tax=Magnetococcus sp. PR-3 TaxID=3120355 RepID=UPI002FCE34F7